MTTTLAQTAAGIACVLLGLLALYVGWRVAEPGPARPVIRGGAVAIAVVGVVFGALLIGGAP